MRISPRTEAPSLLMILTMFVLAVVSWASAPDRIPMHWNAAGQIDRVGGRFEGLFLLPIIAAAAYALSLFLPRIDPRRANYEAFAGAYTAIRTVVIGLLFTIYLFVHLSIRGRTVDMAMLVPLACGVMFIVLGNYLPKFKSNWFVGVRTPWTLSSEESWRKTHHLAGWLFVVAGAVIVAAGLLWPDWLRVVFPVTILTAVAIPTVYSYLVWRHDPARG